MVPLPGPIGLIIKIIVGILIIIKALAIAGIGF